MTVCLHEVHEAIKSSPARWQGETEYVGTLVGFEVGEPDLELRNCRACHSTLALPVQVPEAA